MHVNLLEFIIARTNCNNLLLELRFFYCLFGESVLYFEEMPREVLEEFFSLRIFAKVASCLSVSKNREAFEAFFEYRLECDPILSVDIV